ncbi:hypothetical protein LOD99_9233 [Oopsacas minuta]|uniref:Tc1-like transposase DDE domain-containing protein n=1 Tax=Oopsacas minuta TaxID=111878 RepID=A0AAV7JCB4_9METZ|nr:hypothetical protein LOD99_9233 [Oopsacas minuta]
MLNPLIERLVPGNSVRSKQITLDHLLVWQSTILGYLRKLTCKFNKGWGLSFSHEAVRIEMKRHGFTRKVARKIPMLTQTYKAYRVDWAKSNRCRDWEKVIFSDEMSISLAGGRVFRENLTERLYCDILHECLVEQASVLYPDGWVFQEDNDPKHTCKLAKGYMEEKGIHRMDWPACSPDLNPIENLWSWIKREIDLKSPRNLNELERELNEVWNSLEHEFLRPFWSSMPKRVKLLRKVPEIR